MPLFEQFPYTNFHDLNLDWVLQTVKDLQTQIANITPASVTLQDYEKSANITGARKLSQGGDFSGSILGLASNLVLAGIDSNSQALLYLADQFKSGQTGQVIDGAFFVDSGIHKSYSGGIF